MTKGVGLLQEKLGLTASQAALVWSLYLRPDQTTDELNQSIPKVKQLHKERLDNGTTRTLMMQVWKKAGRYSIVRRPSTYRLSDELRLKIHAIVVAVIKENFDATE